MADVAIAVREAPSGDGAWIALKVVPRARSTGIAGVQGDRLRVRVAAAPEDGRANEALLEFLVARLRVPRKDLKIVRGRGAPHKTVAVAGLGRKRVIARLVEDPT